MTNQSVKAIGDRWVIKPKANTPEGSEVLKIKPQRVSKAKGSVDHGSNSDPLPATTKNASARTNSAEAKAKAAIIEKKPLNTKYPNVEFRVYSKNGQVYLIQYRIGAKGWNRGSLVPDEFFAALRSGKSSAQVLKVLGHVTKKGKEGLRKRKRSLRKRSRRRQITEPVLT